MNQMFAKRTATVHRSFIREILKVTSNPDMISFAGGLPNPRCFPVNEVAAAAAKVMSTSGVEALQYSTTEGYPPLREYIADRYQKRFGFKVDPENILITNGSQQGLDLLGKVFIDEGDRILLERPAYLGAIQAFSIYEPSFRTIPLEEDGPDIAAFQKSIADERIKLFYLVANFQNPSGITCSKQKRIELAKTITDSYTFLIEDDPYGELRYAGEDIPSIRKFTDQQIILLGTFSKIVSPGMRLGWVCAPREVIEKLITMKQGSDLHSNYITQRILFQFLQDNSLDQHIEKIKAAYKTQGEAMVRALEEYCPTEVKFTRPEGGMFIWMTLPEKISSLTLFDLALKENVAFVPGNAFYVDGGGSNTLRLNYSNSDEIKIEEGIKRLVKTIKELMVRE